MAKIRYLTVAQYAAAWDKTTRAVYQRISDGKLLTLRSPDGGNGKMVPVCECADNYFPNRSLCLNCKKTLETKK